MSDQITIKLKFDRKSILAQIFAQYTYLSTAMRLLIGGVMYIVFGVCYAVISPSFGIKGCTAMCTLGVFFIFLYPVRAMVVLKKYQKNEIEITVDEKNLKISNKNSSSTVISLTEILLILARRTYLRILVNTIGRKPVEYLILKSSAHGDYENFAKTLQGYSKNVYSAKEQRKLQFMQALKCILFPLIGTFLTGVGLLFFIQL